MTPDTDNDHHPTAGGNAHLRVLATLLLAGRPNLWHSTHNLLRKYTHTHSHDLQTLGRYIGFRARLSIRTLPTIADMEQGPQTLDEYLRSLSPKSL